MKPKTERRILGVLAAVLVLTFFQLPFTPSASGALYDRWPATPSILDPPRDDGAAGRDIYPGAYWAYRDGHYYFRLDILASFSNNSVYGFYFDTDNNPTTGVSFTGSGLTLSGIDMFVSKLSQNDGTFPDSDDSFRPNYDTEHFLEWRVVEGPESGQLPSSPFTWYGATRNNDGQLKDITGAVTTPIPNAAWLLGSGVVALLVLKRRRPKT